MKKIINSLFKKNLPVSPFLPEDTRVYCIGDIHGCNGLLQQLLAKIAQDAKDFTGKVVMVYLGDFIDRGLHSKEVIDTILANEQRDIDTIYLRGNHEQVLLDSLQNPTFISNWLAFGGLAALASYGIRISKRPTKLQDLLDIQQHLQEKLPDAHYDFFRNTRLSYSLGAYFFVHAGIHPKHALNKQYPEDLLWIRDEFINSDKHYEKIIVHGHSITPLPQLLPNRIGIDTGAYNSGILTCLVLEAAQQRFLQTSNC